MTATRRNSALLAALLIGGLLRTTVSDEFGDDESPNPKSSEAGPEQVQPARNGWEASFDGLTEIKGVDGTAVLPIQPAEACNWSQRWLLAQRDLAQDQASEITALQAHLDRVTGLKKRVMELRAGLLSQQSVRDVEWHCLEARHRLAHAKGENSLPDALLSLARTGYEAAFAGMTESARDAHRLRPVAKPEEAYAWSLRWLPTEREMTRERHRHLNLAALEAHRNRMTELEQKITAIADHLSKQAALDAEWNSLEAQLWLSQATDDDALVTRKARLVLAQNGYETVWESRSLTERRGNVLVRAVKQQEIYAWSQRWLQAQREASDEPSERLAALEAHQRRMTAAVEFIKALTLDLLPKTAASEAEWHLLDARLALVQESSR